jgi:DNA sulfur modification protein DndB
MLDIGFTSNNVKLHSFDTLEGAQLAAAKASASVAGISFPVVMFKQGKRILMNGALPIGFARQRLHRASAQKKTGVSQARLAMNRPIDLDHARTIAKYLAENRSGKFLIPPLTLNVQQPIDVYTLNVESEMKPAYVVMPMTAILSITDGQHREMALELLVELMSPEEMQILDSNSVAVMIVCEADIDQIHQDFADCSKTKPLPASQLAVYDRRNPANGIVLDLIEQCPVFKDKVDATSSTLSAGSLSLFLANQVRQLVKELLVGSYAESDDTFEDKAKKILVARGDPKYNEQRIRFAEYINVVTEAIPTLRRIAELDTSVSLNQIPVLRKEGWVCMTATGMNIIGRIGHELFRDKHSNWRHYATRLGDIDWSKNAPIWEGNIVQNGSKVMTQQTPLKNAVEAVRQRIGLSYPAAAA